MVETRSRLGLDELSHPRRLRVKLHDLIGRDADVWRWGRFRGGRKFRFHFEIPALRRRAGRARALAFTPDVEPPAAASLLAALASDSCVGRALFSGVPVSTLAGLFLEFGGKRERDPALGGVGAGGRWRETPIPARRGASPTVRAHPSQSGVALSLATAPRRANGTTSNRRPGCPPREGPIFIGRGMG